MSGAGWSKRRVLTWVLRAVSVVAFVFAWLRLAEVAQGQWGQVGTSALHQFWLVAVLLILAVAVRGRSTYQVLGAALTGFLSSIGLAMYFGRWITEVMGVVNPWRLALVVPILEEALKLIPFVVVLLIWRGRRKSPGVIDFTLIGLATGAGFALHEDAMWSRVASNGFGGPVGWLLPSLHTQTGLVAGHAVWTGLVGLAIGLAVTRRRKAGWWLVVAVYAIVVFDHGSWNYPPLREDWRWLVGFGWLPVVLLIVGLAVAFLLDSRALRRIPRQSRVVPSDVWRFTRTGTVLNPVGRWFGGRRMMRMAASAAHGHAAHPWELQATAPARASGVTA
jgi:RsiW-degrading membrane proteinase PrsW (M82 family)